MKTYIPKNDEQNWVVVDAAGVPLGRVAVKATTTEKLGFVGRAEGLAAQAAATVRLPEMTAELNAADETAERRARELLRAGHAGRTRADHRDLLAGLGAIAFGLETHRDGAVGDRLGAPQRAPRHQPPRPRHPRPR